MRRTDPIIIGAGPAGCAAAITLALGGNRPLLLERDAEVGDALCGGFVSWRTMETLQSLGVELPGHPITHLRIFSGQKRASAPLPQPSHGLSRHAMDSALVKRAVHCGAGIERGVVVRDLKSISLTQGAAVLLATGKQDLKGHERPRLDPDPALGLRIRLPASPALRALIGDSIELHIFRKGYAGVELQEDGTANICLAVRKSLLAQAGRNPAALLHQLAADNPHFGDRMGGFDARTQIDAVANVPYGWRQTADPHGLYRLGDQCAVIPSLAGEGNGIALASGQSAARALLAGIQPGQWQKDFAQRTRRPVGLATGLWRMSELPLGGRVLTQMLRAFPSLAVWAADATRIRR
jgi:flavin-dependent dehydrogenase